MKAIQFASFRLYHQRVRSLAGFVAVDLRLAFFDSQNRSSRGAVRSGNNDARALKLTEHAGETAVVSILSSGLDRKRNVRHPRGRWRAGVVADRADTALTEIEHDHRFQNVIDLRLFEREIDLGVAADRAAPLDVSDAVAVKNHAPNRQRLRVCLHRRRWRCEGAPGY